MKQCLRGLELAPEYESDLFLVQLIRAQDLSDRIMQLKLLDETELGSHGAAKAPLSSYMRAFLVELEELRSSMPPHLRDNCEFPQIIILIVRESLTIKKICSKYG